MEEKKQCTKCGYISKSNKIKFDKDLCEFCYHFSPDESEPFSKYISEKTDWKSLQSYRKQNKLFRNNQKIGMISKAKKGFVMNRVPFGYKIIGGKLFPDNELSKIVEEIFLEFRDNEISLNKLSKKYGFSLNGLKKILRNYSYLGKLNFDKEIHSSNHEPIISATLFNQVQDKLERLGIK
jgi:hypothetical protein